MRVPPQTDALPFCGGAPLLLIIRSVPISKKAMAFWRRKKDEEFVSLGLSRAAAEPAPQTQNETATELPAPVATRESEAMPGRAPWQTSVLGLDLSIEELQAQEKALEQEFSARFRRAVAATRESLSEKLDTVFQGRKQIDDELLDELEEALIATDIGVATTLEILDNGPRDIARKSMND